MRSSRRTFLASTVGILAGQLSLQAYSGPRQLKIALTPGAIGLKLDQLEIIEACKQFGFEAAEPSGAYLSGLSSMQVSEIKGRLSAARLVWAAAGLPVDFSNDDEKFKDGFGKLAPIVKALQSAGVTRMGTWVPPGNTITYSQNMKRTADRLREVGKLLGDHNLRLGLEYIAPRHAWTGAKYPFVHTMAEMRDLISTIGLNNIGMVLDSWHWFNANEAVTDLKTLTPSEVVSVDLNDAPAKFLKNDYQDLVRELPLATGVIDCAGFLNALHEIGANAPVRCEPFNATLKLMSKDAVLSTVGGSMQKAMALIKTT
jgi:sugar phosphate isomerase/epimerase